MLILVGLLLCYLWSSLWCQKTENISLIYTAWPLCLMHISDARPKPAPNGKRISNISISTSSSFTFKNSDPTAFVFFLFQYAKAKQIQSCSLFAIQGFSYLIVYGLNLKLWALTRDVYDFQHADSYWCQPIKNNPHPLANKIVLHVFESGLFNCQVSKLLSGA